MRDAEEYERQHGRMSTLDKELDEAAEEAAKLRRELETVGSLPLFVVGFLVLFCQQSSRCPRQNRAQPGLLGLAEARKGDVSPEMMVSRRKNGRTDNTICSCSPL